MRAIVVVALAALIIFGIAPWVIMTVTPPETMYRTTVKVETLWRLTTSTATQTLETATTTDWIETTSYAISYYTTTVVIGPGQTVTTTVTSPFPAQVFFSPDGGCKDQLIRWINAANESIHVLIYSFTLDDVGAALIDAHDRGVDVKVLFESQQISEYSEYGSLQSAGIAVKKDTNSALMHNKVAIIDGYVVLTGSFNWSQNAEERNDENLIIIRDSNLANRFENLFVYLWEFRS